jgi:hypothetical protein
VERRISEVGRSHPAYPAIIEKGFHMSKTNRTKTINGRDYLRVDTDEVCDLVNYAVRRLKGDELAACGALTAAAVALGRTGSLTAKNFRIWIREFYKMGAALNIYPNPDYDPDKDKKSARAKPTTH